MYYIPTKTFYNSVLTKTFYYHTSKTSTKIFGNFQDTKRKMDTYIAAHKFTNLNFKSITLEKFSALKIIYTHSCQ